jgi:HEAT repeat protein
MHTTPVGSRIKAMRRLAVLLLAITSLAVPVLRSGASDPKQVEADEKLLKSAKVAGDTPALLAYLRARTLTNDERARVEVLIAQMGALSFRTREQAMSGIIEKGPVVVELLRNHLSDADPEIARRCEKCIEKIKEAEHPLEVIAAAVRLLAARKAAGSTEALLAYLPYADPDTVGDEIRTGLTALAVQEGKVDKVLVAALQDKEPLRRASAAEALTRAGVDETKGDVAALLKDANAGVRWRVATALVMAKNRDAVPALIDSLVEANQAQAWQIQDILCYLAAGKVLPPVSLGSDETARKKFRDAWLAWWKQHGQAVDLAVLQQYSKLLGYTTLVLLDQSKVLELDGNNKVRWSIGELGFPLDVQVLPGDRVLIAEYSANRVTERNFKGEIIKVIPFPAAAAVGDGPQMAQRLADGNTLIGGKYQLLEVTSAGKPAGFDFSVPAGEAILKSSKTPAGEVVMLLCQDGGIKNGYGRVLRVDAAGKELNSFRVTLSTPLFGGRIQGLPNGHVLVPHHGEGKVVEYDSTGKVVWRVTVPEPIVATRLANGNTLVTSGMFENRAVEFDRTGKEEVWLYRSSESRVTRALRR